jgi:uncharacterized protein (DUF934 family)
LPLLDRNGWKAEAYDVVAYADLDAALAAKAPGQKLGVLVPNHIHPRDLAPVQDRLDLIAVDFPRHSDGRGFSLGRMLRQQGFAGTLRATGHVLPDQFGFALHDGFDEVEIDEAQAARQPVEQWLHARALISESYQQTRDGSATIFQKRRAAHVARAAR